MIRPGPDAQPAGMPATTDGAAHGRGHLARWKRSAPDNWFLADENLIEVLQLHLGDQYEAWRERFEAFGAEVAGPVRAAADETGRVEHEPRLRRWDGIGRRTEQVIFHPDHHVIGRAIHGSGILADYDEPGRERGQLVFQYLLCHNGEAGHACPMACTAGLIKILKQLGSEEQQQRWLPYLMDRDHDAGWQGSQFLTEVQGGSDVGANAVEARPVGDGTWRIHGEKWFCSVANAELFLMTARPAGAAAGTRGLGVFAVPRMLADGTPNRFVLRRLKSKLGTRAMASGEIDFDGALAYPIGPVDSGFKPVIEIVLTTSRIYNAVSSAGIMRRAWLEASGFAEAREAFGGSILRFPTVQRLLAEIRTETAAAVSSTWAVIALADKIATGGATELERGAFRVLVGINKLLTSRQATHTVHTAMEVLAGNGAIEDFSALPRLYRDCYVLEAWEGTHNVLAAQLLKDVARYQVDRALLAWYESILDDAAPVDAELADGVIDALRTELAALRAAFAGLADKDPGTASLITRDLAERAMRLGQGLCLLREARTVLAAGKTSSLKPILLDHYVASHIRRLASDQDPGILVRLAALSGAS